MVTLSGENGKIQTLTMQTPGGLPGIPVKSGGNYTDPSGQQWACDEVDLERGVRVQRIYKVDVDGENVMFIQEGAYCNLYPRRLPEAVLVVGQRTNAIATLTDADFYFNVANGGFLYLIAKNIADRLNESGKRPLVKSTTTSLPPSKHHSPLTKSPHTKPSPLMRLTPWCRPAMALASSWTTSGT